MVFSEPFSMQKKGISFHQHPDTFLFTCPKITIHNTLEYNAIVLFCCSLSGSISPILIASRLFGFQMRQYCCFDDERNKLPLFPYFVFFFLLLVSIPWNSIHFDFDQFTKKSICYFGRCSNSVGFLKNLPFD